MPLNAKANPNYVPKRINGKFAPGWSGNPGGSLEATRRSFNKDFLLALAADFKKHGAAAIEKVRKQQPAAYMKICALLVPREMKVEHSGGVKAMSDEEIEQAIEAIQTMLAARAGEAAKVIEGSAEPAALPAPNGPSPEAALKATLEPTKRKPNRLMMEVDTAIGPQVSPGSACRRLLTPDLTMSGRDKWRFAGIGPRERKVRPPPGE